MSAWAHLARNRGRRGRYDLDQHRGPPETLWYDFADQGSVLLPYATLIHLEQADSTERFVSPTNMALSLHAAAGDAQQPRRPARGDRQAHRRRRGDGRGRIDGAPSLIDLYGFLHGI